MVGAPSHLLLAHPANAVFGWASILTAFVTGAILGLRFHSEDFLGGYSAFRRRIVRLGHIALAALGMLNVLYGIYPAPQAGTGPERIASIGLLAGGVLMPAVCFLTGWRAGFRQLFFLPVLCLVIAVSCIIYGGLP